MENNVITPLKGENLTVKMGTNAIYHSTSCAVNLNATFEDWETKDSKGKRKVLKEFAGTIQVDGLMCVFPASTKPDNALDSVGVIGEFYKGAEVQLAVAIENVVYTTRAWITSYTSNGPVAQNATYSVSFDIYKLEPAAQ